MKKAKKGAAKAKKAAPKPVKVTKARKPRPAPEPVVVQELLEGLPPAPDQLVGHFQAALNEVLVWRRGENPDFDPSTLVDSLVRGIRALRERK